MHDLIVYHDGLNRLHQHHPDSLPNRRALCICSIVCAQIMHDLIMYHDGLSRLLCVSIILMACQAGEHASRLGCGVTIA